MDELLYGDTAAFATRKLSAGKRFARAKRPSPKRIELDLGTKYETPGWRDKDVKPGMIIPKFIVIFPAWTVTRPCGFSLKSWNLGASTPLPRSQARPPPPTAGMAHIHRRS